MPLLTPPSPRPAAPARYGLASLSTLVVLGVAVAQRDVGHEEILLLVPSAITAWYGGIGPAILASLLSTLALDYFFVPPLYSWSLPADRIPYVAVFPLFGFGIGWLTASLRRAQESLVRARDELEVKVRERTAELRRSNERLGAQAALLSLAHDAVLVRDPESRVVFWNPGAEETYGWTAEHAMGRVTHDLLQTKFPLSREAVEAALREHGRWEGELTHVTRGGATIVVASRWSLQRDERGAPRAILEINRDVTDRKRAEEALRAAQADLAHFTRVSALGELTASIAHKVSQPLAAVVTNAGACLRWLAHEPPVLGEARQPARHILDDGNRASEVIDRVRALVRRSPPRTTSLSINDTVLEVMALVRGEARSARVTLESQLADDLPRVAGDRIQLQQVILNLIVNAIDATPGVDDGPRDVVVSSDRHSEGVCVAVRDSGVGLASETLDQLFKPFYTTKAEGMGMGLAISRSIVAAHGGRLWATPNDRRGATFHFVVPAEGHPAPSSGR
jgi:two-component system, LuxR family, sensor kinase FixL